MTELPQAASRRELRERERAAEQARSRSQTGRRNRPTRSRPIEMARPVRSGKASVSPRKAQGSRARTIGSRLLSVAAMLFVGALAIGMSVPANAFFPASSGGGTLDSGSSTLASSAGTGGQSVVVSGDQSVEVGTRDKVGVLSWAQVLAQKYSHAGARVGGAGSGSIRWPFPYPVTISSGFGPRIAPCSGCSTYHEGVDFTPGANAAIFAVASGVVTGRDDGRTGYGNYVIITSQLNGHTVKFTYAHMTTASSPITLGETVGVGDFIGLVGETGEATGPHLHFEVNVDGTTIDPIPWLEANAS